MPPLFLAAGDFDPIQVVIVVLFVIGGFLKWVWENWRAKQETGDQTVMDPVEQRLREEAWRKQTGQPPRTAAPPAANDSWADLRKAWNELKEAARQSQAPASPPIAAPPPLQPPPLRQPVQPAPPRRGSVRATLTAAEERAAAARAERPLPPALPAPILVSAPAAVVEHKPPSPFMVALQNLRGNPALMRQAIIMHEVLGPPKALQSSDDSAI